MTSNKRAGISASHGRTVSTNDSIVRRCAEAIRNAIDILWVVLLAVVMWVLYRDRDEDRR